ncbi:MAG: NrfD/PsrC family molybdoenzyme membrane anchor subunit [Acidobacteriota bacterium]
MKEITITTNKITNIVNGHFHAWGWEVPVYLFLGGLTAGILLISAIMAISKQKSKFTLSTEKLSLWAPIILSLGMAALFLDLKHKLYVWRFYTAFEITSPMSWGSWILLFVYPLSFFLILSTIRKAYPKLNKFTESLLLKIKLDKFYNILIDFSEKNRKKIAFTVIPFAIALGVYTGILLSAFGSRPFWNSSILGPLFLVSGLSSAVAAVILFSKEHSEKEVFTRIDLGLLIIEVIFIIFLIIGMASSSIQYKKALNLILGGPLTAPFWIFIFSFGLLLPGFFEVLELRGKKIPSAIAALLVIAGGLFLRFIIVEAGQMSGWLTY